MGRWWHLEAPCDLLLPLPPLVAWNPSASRPSLPGVDARWSPCRPGPPGRLRLGKPQSACRTACSSGLGGLRSGSWIPGTGPLPKAEACHAGEQGSLSRQDLPTRALRAEPGHVVVLLVLIYRWGN